MTTEVETLDPFVTEVRRWVEAEVLPTVDELEHSNTFPEQLVQGMRDLGLFELMLPREYMGLAASYVTYASVVE